MSHKPSDLTVTDVFCGAGGNTIGAKQAGLRVRVGLNHWQRAIETYGANNPEVDVVERVDVSLCDPRRYPSTDLVGPRRPAADAPRTRFKKIPDDLFAEMQAYEARLRDGRRYRAEVAS